MIGIEWDVWQDQDADDAGMQALYAEACRVEGHVWCIVSVGLLTDEGTIRYCQRCGAAYPGKEQE